MFSFLCRHFYRILNRFESKSWMEDGFRTFVPQVEHRFRILIDKDEYQGDIRYSVTLHLFGRAFQITKWRRS